MSAIIVGPLSKNEISYSKSPGRLNSEVFWVGVKVVDSSPSPMVTGAPNPSLELILSLIFFLVFL